MKRKRVWIPLLLLLVAAGVAGYFYFSGYNPAEAAVEEEPELQTATVRRGDITISATGAGSVIPAEEIDLSFPSGGVLKEILVRVGEDIEAGEVLARVDDTAAQETLANAELQLRQAAINTDAASTETGISFDDISTAQAQIELEMAQADLDDLHNWEPDEDEIAQAEANLAAAKANYNAALGSEAASGSNITLKEIDLQQAQADLAAAQEARETAYDPGREWELYIDDPSCRTGEQYPNCTGEPYSDAIKKERESADNAVSRAEENLEIAQINYQSTVSSTNHSGSTGAESNVLSAEIALEAARTGPTEDEIDAAEAAVRKAELAYQQALLSQESNALNLEQAKLNVTAAEAALQNTELVAPLAGTILAINASVGENAGTAALVTLADLEQPLVEIYIDESDLDTIALDYEVDVVFDALPDDVFTGRVVQIDPQISNVNGVPAVRAVVQLDAESFAKPQTLPIGLNATVEVIGGRATGALLVPVEAVREISDGEYAVFVMEEGEPQLRFVEVGLMDFTFAEILSGLEEGDVVTTGIIETE